MSKPMLTRRSFLQGLSLFTTGMVLDPERLLWVPGQRTYFDLAGPRLRELEWVVLHSIRDGWKVGQQLTEAQVEALVGYSASPMKYIGVRPRAFVGTADADVTFARLRGDTTHLPAKRL